MSGPFHPGELEVQRKAGLADEAERIASSISPVLTAETARLLIAQRLLLLGAADERGRVWATALASEPGFMQPLDARTLRIALAPEQGDPLFAALRGSRPAPLGMLLLEPATGRRIRLNGYGGFVEDAIYVRLEHVYVNCRKYIARRRPRERRDPEPAAVPAPSERLSQAQRDWIAAADTFFVASLAGRAADVSHRGGNPGFVDARHERRVSWPDYRGNAMFNTLGNLELDGRAGLVFVDWERGDLLHLSGTAAVDWAPERAAGLAGAQRVVDLTVEAVVERPAALALGWELLGLSQFNP